MSGPGELGYVFLSGFHINPVNRNLGSTLFYRLSQGIGNCGGKPHSSVIVFEVSFIQDHICLEWACYLFGYIFWGSIVLIPPIENHVFDWADGDYFLWRFYKGEEIQILPESPLPCVIYPSAVNL